MLTILKNVPSHNIKRQQILCFYMLVTLDNSTSRVVSWIQFINNILTPSNKTISTSLSKEAWVFRQWNHFIIISFQSRAIWFCFRPRQNGLQTFNHMMNPGHWKEEFRKTDRNDSGTITFSGILQCSTDVSSEQSGKTFKGSTAYNSVHTQIWWSSSTSIFSRKCKWRAVLKRHRLALNWNLSCHKVNPSLYNVDPSVGKSSDVKVRASRKFLTKSFGVLHGYNQ